MLKSEGVESVIIQKRFSLPNCVLIDKFITKDEITNLNYFIKSMRNHLEENYSSFRDLYKMEGEEEDTFSGLELYFYLGRTY